MIPKKLRDAWIAVKKAKFEDEELHALYVIELHKYLGPTKKKDPLEQCRVAVELSRMDIDGE